MIHWGCPEGVILRVPAEGRCAETAGEEEGVWPGGRAREAALAGTGGGEAEVEEGWLPHAVGAEGVETARPASGPGHHWAPPPPARKESSES